MARKKRKVKRSTKRTISPEQQAKMQAARSRKRAHAQKMQVLEASGQATSVASDATLDELRRADAQRRARLSASKKRSK